MVYAAEGHAVGLKGAGNEEDALRKLAQENNTLAAEAAGEEDENCAWSEGLAVFGGVGSFAGLDGDIVSGIVAISRFYKVVIHKIAIHPVNSTGYMVLTFFI